MSAVAIPVSGSRRPALVDPWNARWLGRYLWCLSGEGYVHSRLGGGELILMHVLLVAPPDGLTVDHIDRDPLNNVEANLRLATKQEQMWNMGLRSDNTSGFKGVTEVSGRRKRFLVQIQLPDGRRSRYFYTGEEAAEQYDEWAVAFGEFACTNRDLGLL